MLLLRYYYDKSLEGKGSIKHHMAKAVAFLQPKNTQKPASHWLTVECEERKEASHPQKDAMKTRSQRRWSFHPSHQVRKHGSSSNDLQSHQLLLLLGLNRGRLSFSLTLNAGPWPRSSSSSRHRPRGVLRRLDLVVLWHRRVPLQCCVVLRGHALR